MVSADITSPQPEEYHQTIGRPRREADRQVGEEGDGHHQGGGRRVGRPVARDYLEISQLTILSSQQLKTKYYILLKFNPYHG